MKALLLLLLVFMSFYTYTYKQEAQLFLKTHRKESLIVVSIIATVIIGGSLTFVYRTYSLTPKEEYKEPDMAWRNRQCKLYAKAKRMQRGQPESDTVLINN